MDARTLSFIASACSGKILRGSAETPVLRVCSDSRQVQAGDLFVALKGDTFDGHEFLELVAGKNPFDDVPPGELMARVASPAIAHIQQVEALCPGPVAQTVMKALASARVGQTSPSSASPSR